MKNLFRSIMLVAAAATAFACSQDKGIDTPQEEVKITLQAGRPDIAADGQTRTEMIEIGGVITPHWSAYDRIGVHIHGIGNSNHPFLNDNITALQETSFTSTGAIGLASDATFSAYYPYSEEEVGEDVQGYDKGAVINLPAIQHPKPTSFDGDADLLVGKHTSIDELTTGSQVEGLLFKRLTGVIRVNLKDVDGLLAGEKIASLKLDTKNQNYSFAGHVTIDLQNYTLASPHNRHSTSVTAQYGTEAPEIGKTGEAVYLSVYPHTLLTGSKLYLQARTDNYMIEKEITLAENVVIAEGKITTLNIGIKSEHITSSVLNLPFADDFTDLTGSAAYDVTVRTNGDGQPLWSASERVWRSGGGLCISSNVYSGYIVTSDINLPATFTVRIMAKLFNDTRDVTAIKVTAAGKTMTTAPTLTGGYASYLLKFNASAGKSEVRIEPSAALNAAVIESVEIIAGHDVTVTPILTRTSSGTESIDAAGGTVTIEYTLQNGAGNAAAIASEGFVSAIDTSTAGKIVCTVDKNQDTTNGRSATVTVSYPGARPFDVTINQGKASTGGADDTTFIFEQICDNSNSSYVLTSLTQDGVTLTFSKGTGTTDPKYFRANATTKAAAYVNLPNGSELTISRADGRKVTKVVFSITAALGASRVGTSIGTYTADDRTWISDGSYSSVPFSVTGGAVSVSPSITVYFE